MSAPLLEMENIGRRFGGLVALEKVSFKVARGVIKSVIGPNGAGKTTVFNVISGLLRSDTGHVMLKGRRLNGMRPFQIARAGVSRTFQNPSLFLQMSVLENVMVGCHGRTRREFAACCLHAPGQRKEERAIREAARAHVARLGLEPWADAPAGALSFGQRRMVELARALATEPELLLLDEPASGLNTRETEDLGQLIQRFRESGITVLLVEHDMSLVMGISDDIVVLHDGRVIAEGTPWAIQEDQNVVSVYLGGDFRHVAAGQEP